MRQAERDEAYHNLEAPRLLLGPPRGSAGYRGRGPRPGPRAGPADRAQAQELGPRTAAWPLLERPGHFLLKYSFLEVLEVYKNRPGARGFVFPKYQPMVSHGDPIHV